MLSGRRTAGRSYICSTTGLATILLALSLCGSPPAAAQGDWIPELESLTSETRGRSDPIVILLPADLDPAVYRSLAVELDDLDVTAFVALEGPRLVVTPPEPLSTGSHSLRLVERSGDGAILERGYWSLEIRHSDLIRDLSLNADLAGEVNARIAENGVDVPPQHVTGESAGNVEAAAGDDHWRITAQGNYLYNSQLELGIDERNLDLGEFRIDGDYERESSFAGFTVGDHDTGIENLIMSGFYRRGVSLRAGLADERLTVTGFVQRTEAMVGTKHVLGISHDEERVEGVSVSVRPVEALKDNVVLTGTYYTGEGGDGGFGIGSEEAVNEGDGWSIAADTLWFDEALRLRGEYAQTSFDFDGKDQGFDAENAEAYSVLASLEPLRGATLDGSVFTWTIGVQRDEVDTFFSSLANPYLEPDRETTSVFSDFLWDEFSAQLRVDHQVNNVDDLDYLPTDRNINVYFNGNYTPYVEPLEDGSLPWYGQPFFGLSASFFEIDRIDRSQDFPDDDANNSTRSLTLSAGANYESWNWNLSHTIYSFEDHVDLSSDTRNNSTALSAYVMVDDWLSLQPSVQWDNFEDLDTGDDNQSLLLNLGANVTVIPETLDATLYYSLNHRMGDGDTPDTNSLNGEVVWTLRQADVNRLGVALALSGNVQDTNDDFDNPEKDLQYQAFTSLRLSLPVAY
ncbi:hypothetical protein AAFN88_13825 [Pelagibius sp. CAU 1746]|uniref:hypothetical protein n=1 Tax=Pelagibius sp. CAU 1746 TaxID=3140370 RepID=UPI00325BD503